MALEPTKHSMPNYNGMPKKLLEAIMERLTPAHATKDQLIGRSSLIESIGEGKNPLHKEWFSLISFKKSIDTRQPKVAMRKVAA